MPLSVLEFDGLKSPVGTGGAGRICSTPVWDWTTVAAQKQANPQITRILIKRVFERRAEDMGDLHYGGKAAGREILYMKKLTEIGGGESLKDEF